MGFVDTESSTLSPSQAPSTLSDEESSPFLDYAHYTGSPTDLRTPTAINNDPLSATRLRRKRVTESQEIWEELQDDPLPPPLSPFSAHHRATSIRSTPSKAIAPADLEREDENIDLPHEGTSLLERGRIGTGRTYRSRRRRSAPMLARGDDEAKAQGATGGWWKMGWWGGGGEIDKGKGRRSSNRVDDGSNDDRGGDGEGGEGAGRRS